MEDVSILRQMICFVEILPGISIIFFRTLPLLCPFWRKAPQFIFLGDSNAETTEQTSP